MSHLAELLRVNKTCHVHELGCCLQPTRLLVLVQSRLIKLLHYQHFSLMKKYCLATVKFGDILGFELISETFVVWEILVCQTVCAISCDGKFCKQMRLGEDL